MEGMHLWEIDHAYYCNLGNYYNNDCGSHFRSWNDFLEEMGSADFDYNLLFRWDWNEEDKRVFTGDDNYRNGQLELFLMHQRKGRYVYMTIEVCRADEAAVRAYLEPRWKYLCSLWAPISQAKQP